MTMVSVWSEGCRTVRDSGGGWLGSRLVERDLRVGSSGCDVRGLCFLGRRMSREHYENSAFSLVVVETSGEGCVPVLEHDIVARETPPNTVGIEVGRIRKRSPDNRIIHPAHCISVMALPLLRRGLSLV